MTGRGQSIVLIGFMGAGKSSAGRALARKNRTSHFSTRMKLSPSRFGLPVTEIFVRLGEEEFRNAETEALRQLSEAAPAIIVTGGGIVLRPENVKMLRELGQVVSLEADEETLFRRISRRATRPLLQTKNPRATMAELLRDARPALPRGGGRSTGHVAADARRSGRRDPEEHRKVMTPLFPPPAPPRSGTALELKREIVERAEALGFDSCKIAAAASPRHGNEFRAWLREGAAGEMDWLARGEEKEVRSAAGLCPAPARLSWSR